MFEILCDTLLDTLKMIPFLFIAFFIMEYIEHKFSKKNTSKLKKAGKFGPVIGSILGAFPQCGFSVMATNLYATRIISLGTLIAVYLSTSDEMLPILISEGAKASSILFIIIYKIIIGLICGFVIDFVYTKSKDNEIKDFCKEHHCDCKHSLLKSTIKHTLSITFFILIVNLILNVLVEILGYDKISHLFLKNSIISPFISGIIGLIPNCGASVIITELYINGVITFGSTIAGLLAGSGVALVLLFKVNKNIKENLVILSTIYLIGSISGVIIEIVSKIL